MLRAVASIATQQRCSPHQSAVASNIARVLHRGREERTQAWVGCSHWTGPYRPIRSCSSKSTVANNDMDATPDSLQSLDVDESSKSEGFEAESHDRAEVADVMGSEEGITIDQVEPTKLNRPQLPTSIKKLNRLLSHDRSIPIPDSDLIERFVKGRGPGGQAINKTNSSVSLIHIPTGIRIQSQPTRSREENRKIARKILAERLDLLRAHEAAKLPRVKEDEEGVGKSRKEKERDMAGVWSREEIRWEKERRRKVNRSKKTKKKRKESALESETNSEFNSSAESV